LGHFRREPRVAAGQDEAEVHSSEV
jgi:hypothetical protein